MTNTTATLQHDDPGMDLSIVALTALLAGIGIVAVFSASFAKYALSSSDAFYLVKRQAFAAVLGAVVMVGVSRLNLERVRASAYAILGIAVVALLAVLKLGVEINGAHRWFQVGFLHLQPSEFAKLALIIAASRYVLDNRNNLRSVGGLFAPIAAAGALAFLVVIEPDLGTAVVILLLAFLVYHLGGAKIRHLAVYATVGLFCIAIAILASPYRRERVFSWLFPHKTAMDSGYQLRHSVIALGAGGPFGRGLGESREKYSYLPAAETDCIFAIIGEETGLIGTWGLLAVFGLLLWRGMTCAMRAADPYHSLLAAGVTAMLLIQVILNVAVVTGLMPTKGQPLPFVSYGGSSLVLSMAAAGLLLNISRQPQGLLAAAGADRRTASGVSRG